MAGESSLFGNVTGWLGGITKTIGDTWTDFHGLSDLKKYVTDLPTEMQTSISDFLLRHSKDKAFEELNGKSFFNKIIGFITLAVEYIGEQVSGFVSSATAGVEDLADSFNPAKIAAKAQAEAQKLEEDVVKLETSAGVTGKEAIKKAKEEAIKAKNAADAVIVQMQIDTATEAKAATENATQAEKDVAAAAKAALEATQNKAKDAMNVAKGAFAGAKDAIAAEKLADPAISSAINGDDNVKGKLANLNADISLKMWLISF